MAGPESEVDDEGIAVQRDADCPCVALGGGETAVGWVLPDERGSWGSRGRYPRSSACLRCPMPAEVICRQFNSPKVSSSDGIYRPHPTEFIETHQEKC